MEELISNNQVTIAGEIVSDFKYSHELFGEKFYMAKVAIIRWSGFCDNIPIMLSEHLVNLEDEYIGKFIMTTGQFRSYVNHEVTKGKLLLYVFAKSFDVISMEEGACNQIMLDGYLCKNPIFRRTPTGKEITEMLVAVNRPFNKSDYIPCICWNRNARFARRLSVGNHIQLYGRIQSREYIKRISEDEIERHTAYEVSANKIILQGEEA